MTDNTEPNLDEILRRIAYWNGYDSADEWDRTGHEAKAQIEHYIANQVREARLDELEHLFDRADGERSARRYTAILEQRIKVLRTRLNGAKNR